MLIMMLFVVDAVTWKGKSRDMLGEVEVEFEV